MNSIGVSIQYLMHTSLAVHNTLFFGYMYPNLQTYIFFCLLIVKFLTLVVYNFLT